VVRHTVAYTLSGQGSEGCSRPSLAMKVARGWRPWAKGDPLAVGDSRDPLLHAGEMRACSFLLGKTNLCQAIRGTQGPGLMPDGKQRFSRTASPSIT